MTLIDHGFGFLVKAIVSSRIQRRDRASTPVSPRRDERERCRRCLLLRGSGVVRGGSEKALVFRGVGGGRVRRRNRFRRRFREDGIRFHRHRRRRARRGGRRARPAHLGLQARLRVHHRFVSVPERAARRRRRGLYLRRRRRTPTAVCHSSRRRRRRLARGEAAEVHARARRRRRRHRRHLCFLVFS